MALVYGSAAAGQLRCDSDIDVALLGQEPLTAAKRLLIYEQLELILKRKVVLIDLYNLQGEILHQILTRGKIVIKKDHDAYFKLLQRMVYNEEDFMPQVRQALLTRVQRFAYG